MKVFFSTLFWLLFAIYISIESYHLGLGRWNMPGAGYFPFMAGVLLGGISFSLLVKALLKVSVGKPSLEKASTKLNESESPLNWHNIILTLAGMLVYIPLLHWLGFVLSTLLLMVFLIRAVGRQGWFVSIIAALSVTLASYLIFELALDSQLPKGILESFL